MNNYFKLKGDKSPVENESMAACRVCGAEVWKAGTLCSDCQRMQAEATEARRDRRRRQFFYGYSIMVWLLLALLPSLCSAQAIHIEPGPDAARNAAYARLVISKPDARVHLGAGDYDFGVDPIVDVGDNARIWGDGYDPVKGEWRTKLLARGHTHSSKGCEFRPNGNLLLEDLQLDSNPDVELGQSQTFGFQSKNAPSNCTVVCRRVSFRGESFGVYIWGGMGHVFVFEECHAHARRWALTVGQAGDIDDQTVIWIGGSLTVDGTLPAAGGDIGNSNVGAVVRGGRLFLRRGINGPVKIRVKGTKGLAAYGIWNTPQPGKPSDWVQEMNPTTQAEGADILIDPNGASEWADVARLVGWLKVVGGRGSGEGRKMISSGHIDFK